MEHCVYLPNLQNLTLSSFLLVLQLISDIVQKKSLTSLKSLTTLYFMEDIFQFINKNEKYMDHNSLKCLHKDHIIQHHWRIEKNKNDNYENNSSNYELE